MQHSRPLIILLVERPVDLAIEIHRDDGFCHRPGQRIGKSLVVVGNFDPASGPDFLDRQDETMQRQAGPHHRDGDERQPDASVQRMTPGRGKSCFAHRSGNSDGESRRRSRGVVSKRLPAAAGAHCSVSRLHGIREHSLISPGHL